MCGIAGFVQLAGRADRFECEALRMADAIRHRGPDDEGVWVDSNAGVALAHRRLSILDLSPAGHQPMLSACQRYVLVFNGEIYNHLELRASLDAGGGAYQWRGHSDTETLLACFAAWGVEHTLKATVGMFAIALWDRHERLLVLARDRLGEKPLYYGVQRGTLLFGSELKALKAHSDFAGEIDRGSLALLLRHNCIPAPHSIYRGIHKLMPGHMLCISVRQSPSDIPDAQPYWSLNSVVQSGLSNPFDGTPAEAVDLLEQRLAVSVEQQMLSDVPLGAFLSGGVDSSAIVSLMQSRSSRRVRTFTMGFDSTGLDEAVHAKAVARHLGTEHTELYVRPGDVLQLIPDLPNIYCEPFSDSSQIPTYLVCQLARQHVSVALSGDGGDELFGGYNRYLAARGIWRQMQILPGGGRRAAAAALRSLSPDAWNRLLTWLRPVLPQRFRLSAPGDKAHKLASVLTSDSGSDFYRSLTSHWANPADMLVDGLEHQTLQTQPDAWPVTDSLEHWMMAMDAQTYMSDDILVKVDRAAMANSLETRVPLLDHRVVELAWRMPLDLKMREGEGKWLLRQVLYRHVPRELIERPKQGFGVPLDAWLRGPLREWAEALLEPSRLAEEGFFRPEPVRQLWTDHLYARANHQERLWSILMFQAWLEVQ